jgi:hypothetical protein
MNFVLLISFIPQIYDFSAILNGKANFDIVSLSDIVICTMVHDCTLYTGFERLTVLIYHVRVLIDDPLLPTVVLEG